MKIFIVVIPLTIQTIGVIGGQRHYLVWSVGNSTACGVIAVVFLYDLCIVFDYVPSEIVCSVGVTQARPQASDKTLLQRVPHAPSPPDVAAAVRIPLVHLTVEVVDSSSRGEHEIMRNAGVKTLVAGVYVQIEITVAKIVA